MRNHPLDPKGPRRPTYFQIGQSIDQSAELVAGTDGGGTKVRLEHGTRFIRFFLHHSNQLSLLN